MRRKTIDNGISSSTALSVESRGRQNNKQNNRGRSPTRGMKIKIKRQVEVQRKTIVCWNCNKEGHKKNDCMEPKKKKGAGGRPGDDEGANMDVRHIPELQKNLISISGLDREGYFVAFGEKQWKMTKGSMVVVRGERVGTLYTLSGTQNHSISLTFTENQRTTLWHHRLGHLSESGMKILHSKNALPGMKNIQLDFCEGCVYGKQKRVSFWRDGKEKKIERLELVHTDVCGPTTVKSLGDDASRKTGIYAIRQKSDVCHTFKKWKVLVENETGNKIKCLKSDNGGKYHDGRFQEYCSNTGIRLIRTIKRTPQENGLAERMNGTIMERARSLASALNCGIPEEEWSDDMLVAGSSMRRINELKKKLASILYEALGRGKEEYIEKVLMRFNFHASKPMTTPLAAHFKLSKELSPKNRKDKEYMAQIHDKPRKGTLANSEMDSQKIVALSTMEAEYVAMTEASKKIIWLQRLLTKLGYGQVDCKLWANSQSAIHLAKNSAFHLRTKNIQLKYHFIRSLLEDGQLNLEKIEGNKNPVDMLTKETTNFTNLNYNIQFCLTLTEATSLSHVASHQNPVALAAAPADTSAVSLRLAARA
ncbi:hypothetical protein RJ639_016049 [Escallonia herrerae]|uniref:Polyprotein n=1 Tax=Escallonia herrerae TaxID=1293975 RepID=A0AA88VGB9_9ASTE|nr:hypothetical protein RJ639_016049 [Escallonia herrerae]